MEKEKIDNDYSIFKNHINLNIIKIHHANGNVDVFNNCFNISISDLYLSFSYFECIVPSRLTLNIGNPDCKFVEII